MKNIFNKYKYLLNKYQFKMDSPTKRSEKSNIYHKLLNECVEYLLKLGHESYCNYINKNNCIGLDVDAIREVYEIKRYEITVYYDHIYGENIPFSQPFNKLFYEFDKLIIKLEELLKNSFREYNMWSCNRILI